MDTQGLNGERRQLVVKEVYIDHVNNINVRCQISGNNLQQIGDKRSQTDGLVIDPDGRLFMQVVSLALSLICRMFFLLVRPKKWQSKNTLYKATFEIRSGEKGTVRSYWMGLHCIKQSWLVVTVWKSGFSKQFSNKNSSPKKRECYQHCPKANFVTCRSWPRTRSECGTPIGPGQKLKHWSRTTQLWLVKIVLIFFLTMFV